MLTIREVAEKTGASAKSIRVWLSNDEQRAKRFPNAVKEETPVGGYWMIPETDIQGYVNPGRGRPPLPESELKRRRKTPSVSQAKPSRKAQNN